jgi:hypothetical protein
MTFVPTAEEQGHVKAKVNTNMHDYLFSTLIQQALLQ